LWLLFLPKYSRQRIDGIVYIRVLGVGQPTLELTVQHALHVGYKLRIGSGSLDEEGKATTLAPSSSADSGELAESANCGAAREVGVHLEIQRSGGTNGSVAHDGS